MHEFALLGSQRVARASLEALHSAIECRFGKAFVFHGHARCPLDDALLERLLLVSDVHRARRIDGDHRDRRILFDHIVG